MLISENGELSFLDNLFVRVFLPVELLGEPDVAAALFMNELFCFGTLFFVCHACMSFSLLFC